MHYALNVCLLDKDKYYSLQTSILGRGPTLLFELVREVRELAIKVKENKIILTNEQFILSDLYKKLAGANKNQYNTLLNERGWKLFENKIINPYLLIDRQSLMRQKVPHTIQDTIQAEVRYLHG